MLEQAEALIEEATTNANSELVATPPQASTLADDRLTTLTELIEQLHQDTMRQCTYARKQLFFTRLLTAIFAVAFIAMLCVCVVAAPRVMSLATGADALIAQAQTMAQELETVSSQLAEANIGGMLKNVDTLVLQGQASIAEALGSVNTALEGLNGAITMLQSFDISTLNASIQDLRSITAPLAQLLGR